MAGQLSVARILGDAATIIDVWTANPNFTMGSVTKDNVVAAVAEMQAAHAAVETQRTQLTGLMDARDAKATALRELVTRARSGIRAAYGPDSAQYEQSGGTRTSERKPRRRNPPAGAVNVKPQ
jgi:hypothetical protein